ncbi:hypothetical protein L914_21482 [Phytophthora nicotianae]|uniref:ZSWIM1/3 RNaseH-like domain-containing protein n=3 Tax=Phytophthora nicotianae TaxID=4792 RepID=V9E569_PHYNI|nr:hypothetical protein F443_19331 [Phytophthora nicotianae P1569]ETM30843.1 hypothetical protein L914_21482 [Phytophthora nicotianae]
MRDRKAKQGAKLMFERWGETLAMDFTHGTNSLGYHLGSLLVTTATGRGFLVLDFICRDQQAVAISAILTYFKEKNPGWRNIVSVVIGKDFVEWWALMESFPDVKVVLCQFHAIAYWKMVMKRSTFRLTISQQEGLIELMTRLLYW